MAIRHIVFITGFFAWIGAFVCFLALPAKAQWRNNRLLTLHRGQIAHSVFNEGMSGWKDQAIRFEAHSLSYPMGRHLKVFSGGNMRAGWNARRMTGGEGIWIMSRTGGQAHVSAAGSEGLSQDIESLSHDPSGYPEAYLGVVHDEDWALAIRKDSGAESNQATGIPLVGRATNWWPAAVKWLKSRK